MKSRVAGTASSFAVWLPALHDLRRSGPFQPSNSIKDQLPVVAEDRYGFFD
jgi:hypothetical protein